MSLNLSFKVEKPIETVFENLIDMQKFVSFHPVITKIEPISDNNYLVYETLRFGFIPVTFQYPVVINSNLAEKKVKMVATVLKFTKIEMNFVLKTIENFTIITESIHFKSPFPVKGIMSRIFKKQHSILFKKMNL
ncbi:SRPBCC family protein [Lacihabitans sp. CCS-44]|uniref:SRPBCC family protein n=1 Tax=Lacihabitans sp. CCS-44 TaxID=2487331 RepID=UPI0020CF5DCE|nr:SRPBCC family protein [Lacihabitans sp. CCS-44]MCP9754190.1 SRPBCC family protein [Lacihabitans sp. CCS-44]